MTSVLVAHGYGHDVVPDLAIAYNALIAKYLVDNACNFSYTVLLGGHVKTKPPRPTIAELQLRCFIDARLPTESVYTQFECEGMLNGVHPAKDTHQEIELLGSMLSYIGIPRSSIEITSVCMDYHAWRVLNSYAAFRVKPRIIGITAIPPRPNNLVYDVLAWTSTMMYGNPVGWCIQGLNRLRRTMEDKPDISTTYWD